MLHVTPLQGPPAIIRASSLASQVGWIDVEQRTMRHTQYATMFVLGDSCSAPYSKTVAAVRKQSPVVVRNILRAMKDQELKGGYDDYASGPLMTVRGKVIIAEFICDEEAMPTKPHKPGEGAV